MSSDSEVDAETPCVADTKTGLPIMSKEAKKKGFSSTRNLVAGLLFLPRAIGVGIACAIYFPMQETYDQRMCKFRMAINGNVSQEVGYLFLSLALISLLTNVLNNVPMLWKSLVLPGNAGNLRANMMIYQVNVPDGAPTYPAVVLQEEGDVGKYNRANRGLQHFNENSLPVALNVLAGAFIFPLPVFVLTCVYVVARIWYQIAYAIGGYGFGCCKHALPFMIHGALLPPIYEGLMWITGIVILLQDSNCLTGTVL